MPAQTVADITRRGWGTLIAEWVKFGSLLSNRVMTAIALLFVPLNSILLTVSLRQRAEDPDPGFLIPEVGPFAFLDSVLWLQLLVSVLAVLVATGEHRGHLGLSILAVPTRVPVAIAKAAMVALVAFAVGVVGAVAGLLLPLLTLADSMVSYAVDGAETAVLALSSGVYLAGIACVSFGFAVLVRHLVVAVLAPIAFLTIVPAVLEWAGGEVVATVTGFLPSVAGRTAISAMVNPAGLDAVIGLATLGAWSIVAVAAAAVAYRWRDA